MIFDTIKTYAATGLAIALAAALAWGGVQTLRLSELKRQNAEALAKATQQARDKEEAWQSDAAVADGVHDEEIARINREHVAALRGLRNRAAARLPKTPAACAGASPASLAAPDSAVALGWGAEFDSLRTEYIKCKAGAEMIRR